MAANFLERAFSAIRVIGPGFLRGLRPFVTSNVFEGYGAPSRTPSPRAARAGGSLLLSAVFAGGRVRSLLRPRKELSATTITWRSLTSPRLASFPRHPKRPIVSIPSPGVRNAQVNPIRAGSLSRGLRPFSEVYGLWVAGIILVVGTAPSSGR